MGRELDLAGSVYKLSEGNTVPARAMLSVHDTEIATQKILPKFEQCSCSLKETVLY